MADPTIRGANIAVLIKLETIEGVDANPDPAVDAIPVETDSLTRNSPWTTEASNEATGSYVAGAAMVIGQAATVGFRSRLKGAGVGVVYSATVKPPLHAALQACGRRGLFHGSAPAAASAGSATSVTLAAAYPATLRALVGVPLSITGGAGTGSNPLVIDYSTGRVATLADRFAPPLDNTSVVALPECWSYAATSPADAAARLVDQPTATIHIYRDGQLWRFTGCRGVVTLDGRSARPGFAAFSFSGEFAGRTDAAMPGNLVIANHMAPLLVQGNATSPAVLLDRKPLPISTWSLDAGAQASSVDDPNTAYGFGSGQIFDRTPVLRLDPLATTVAARDTIAAIGAGTTYSAVLRCGTQAGNRWALTIPRAQLTGEEDGSRDRLVAEQLTLQPLNAGREPSGRDTDSILTFY